MDCRTVRELADSFLSEQLLVETNHEVLRHVETCAACRAELAARRAIRERVRGAFVNATELTSRPGFAAELAARLRQRSVSAGATSDPGISRRSLLRSWWTAAAGVLLAAGGTMVGVRQARARSQLTALAVTAAGDHQNCAIKFTLAERPISLEEASRRYGMPYGQMASFEVPALTPAAEVLDRHSCVYGDHRFAHVVFRYRGAVTSLVVTRGAGPSQPRIERKDGSPAVASLPAGDFVAFVVADLPAEDVLDVARTIAGPLARQLSV